MQQDCENLTAHKTKTSKKSKSTEEISEYAKIANKMGTNGTIRGARAEAGAGTTDGEIIQVQGGHIIRATGRKDRHSKVYTSKGPRDRRVRLSAHTAIQFYDVQDRLGYDRPSKAVDWLMKKAKDAIDKLNDSPNDKESITNTKESISASRSIQELEHQQESPSARYAFQLQRQLGGELPNGSSSIGDSMKSFFPLSSGTSMMEMQSYPHDRISRMGIQSEDLGLSLHSQNMNQRSYSDHELLLHGSNSIPFEQNYSKPEPWNNNNNLGVGENNRVGFILNPQTIPQQLFGGQQNSAAFTQREPLQSNYSNLFHSWNERMLPSVDQQNAQPVLQSALYNIYFGSNFQVPARIHGEEEHSPGSHL